MNSQEYWDKVCEKYPEWKNEERVVKLRVRGIRNLIFQAVEECRLPERKTSMDTPDVFNELFGNKFK